MMDPKVTAAQGFSTVQLATTRTEWSYVFTERSCVCASTTPDGASNWCCQFPSGHDLRLYVHRSVGTRSATGRRGAGDQCSDDDSSAGTQHTGKAADAPFEQRLAWSQSLPEPDDDHVVALH